MTSARQLRHDVLADPIGELVSWTRAMPTDATAQGDIFAGWILMCMERAAHRSATQYAQSRVVTVAVSNVTVWHPIQVGDTVCYYTTVLRVGSTSLTLSVEVWVRRQGQGERLKATAADFTVVAVDDDGCPRPLAGVT